MTSPWYRAALNAFPNDQDWVNAGCPPMFIYADEWERAIANLGRCLRDAGALSASFRLGWDGCIDESYVECCMCAVYTFEEASEQPEHACWFPGCGRSAP